MTGLRSAELAPNAKGLILNQAGRRLGSMNVHSHEPTDGVVRVDRKAEAEL